jgi:hypothetical protein
MNIFRVFLLLLGLFIVGCQKENQNLKANPIKKVEAKTMIEQKPIKQNQ